MDLKDRLIDIILRYADEGSKDRSIRTYLVATSSVLIVLIFRMYLTTLGATAPYITFIGAIMFSSVYGGLKAGLYATSLSAFIANLLFVNTSPNNLQPVNVLFINFFVFIGLGTTISALSEAMHMAIRRENQRRNDFLESEERLRLSEERFKAIYKSNMVGIIQANIEGAISDVNDAFLNMIGYSREDYDNDNINWKDLTDNEFVEKDRVALENLMETGYILPYEKAFIKRDSTKIPVILGAAILSKRKNEFIMFVLDITEHKKVEQRKDEFISVASHELKTPLTSIKGYTQILEKHIKGLGDEKLETYLKKTNIYIDRLNDLIGDLLDVSKIQAGKIQFDVEEFDFNLLVNEVVENISATTSTHKIIKTGHTTTTICGDRNRLEQVINNLLTNAIKYSPQADNVYITIAEQEEHLVMSVIDSGIGIPADKVDKIFQRFYRVDESAKKVSGLGIGLYLSNEIVSRHDGKIIVQSEEGKGSRFDVYLPKINSINK